MVEVYLKTIDGVDNVVLSVDKEISTQELDGQLRSHLPSLVSKRSIISESKGRPITQYTLVSDLVEEKDNMNNGSDYINLHLRIPMCGGKGGFGNSLKTQGAKMKNGKTDKGNYRTLDGIKIKTIRQLQKIDLHMKSLPEQEKLNLQKKRDKLQKILDMDTKKAAQSDPKYDDEKYLNDLQTTMDDVRDTVFGGVSDEDSQEEEDSEKDDDDSDNSKNENASGIESDSDESEENVPRTKQHSRSVQLDSFFK